MKDSMGLGLCPLLGSDICGAEQATLAVPCTRIAPHFDTDCLAEFDFVAFV